MLNVLKCSTIQIYGEEHKNVIFSIVRLIRFSSVQKFPSSPSSQKPQILSLPHSQKTLSCLGS